MKRITDWLLRITSPELAELRDQAVTQQTLLNAARGRITRLEQTLAKSNTVNEQLVTALEHSQAAYELARDRADVAESFLKVVGIAQFPEVEE